MLFHFKPSYKLTFTMAYLHFCINFCSQSNSVIFQLKLNDWKESWVGFERTMTLSLVCRLWPGWRTWERSRLCPVLRHFHFKSLSPVTHPLRESGLLVIPIDVFNVAQVDCSSKARGQQSPFTSLSVFAIQNVENTCEISSRCNEVNIKPEK